MCLILINIILVLIIVPYLSVQECSINIKEDLSSKSPIFFNNNKLHIPVGPYLTWKSGTEEEIICSGQNNVFNYESINSNRAKIKCSSENKLTVNDKQVNVKKLECKAYNTGDVIKTKQTCLNDGILHEIGFYIKDKKFVKYIDVCYDLRNASVKYTRHFIPGEAIKYSISESRRPSFSVKGMPKHVKPNLSYKQSGQKDRFTQLLGPKTTSFYLNSTSFLARGHLAPDKDGIFRSWQYATYFYLNVAPQWQSVNALNWLRVENLARKKAAQLEDNLEVVTGISGILTLKNDHNRQVPVTLEDNGNIPVPKYFWKILKYKSSAIAFVSLNNPFENSIKICKSICEKYNWPTKDFDILQKGVTYCCSVSDLLNAFPEDVPKEFLTKKILSY